MRTSAAASWVFVLVLTTGASAQGPDDIFMIRSTAKPREAVVAAIRSHAEQRQWQYLGDSTVKNGEVTLLKVCIPEVGRALWPAGLQLSAMLPCGNVGIYGKGAGTEISVLHPRYMHVLHPHPATERAGAIAAPLLAEMLDAAAR